MAGLDVEGAFLITIGQGAGPQTELVISVAGEDGKPIGLDFDKDQSKCSSR